MQQFNKPLSLNSVLVGVYAGEKGVYAGEKGVYAGENNFFNPFVHKELKGVSQIG